MHIVRKVPVPPTQSDINRYRDLRIKAVRTDPSCFSSPYEREVSLTEEIWRARLNSDNKATFVAIAIGGNEEEAGVGMATILGPESMKEMMDEFPEQARESRMPLYLIVGMWVDPTHRKRGLGGQLIEACFEWARLKGRDGYWVMLQVNAENVGGIKLYEKMDFVELRNPNELRDPNDSQKEGLKEMWMKRMF